jgi:hypothetical protein
MKKYLSVAGIALIAFALLALPACKGKGAGERTAERALEKATGGKAEVNVEEGGVSIKTKDGEVQLGALSSWPADMPTDIPKFEGAKVYNAAKTESATETTWIVNFRDAEGGAVDSYIEGLKSAGFSSEMSSNTEETTFFTAKKGDLDITVAFVKNDKGLSLSVSKSK